MASDTRALKNKMPPHVTKRELARILWYHHELRTP
jgi:hypothetical protein